MFQIKDFVSIVASMVNHMRGTQKKITDFQPGSVARTLIEGPAVEIEELYIQMFLGLREAIPVATFLSFGFNKLPASTAHGYVTVSADEPPAEDMTVPMGTQFASADGRSYISTAAVTWEAGQHVVRIPVAAEAAGLSGNIAAGQIVSSDLFGDGYVVSNALIDNGRDDEADAEREARFADFVAALSRGTVVACLYAARMAQVLDEDGNVYEYVARTGLVENPGHVRIYIYSSRGVASPELLENGQRILDGWRDDVSGEVFEGFRSAGVRVDILPMVQRVVPFAVQVEMLPGFSLSAATRQQLDNIFVTIIAGVQPGDVLYIGTLVDAFLSVSGVRRVVPASNENIVCGHHEALIAGELAVASL